MKSYLFVYHTGGRVDGFDYAVASNPKQGRVNQLALFASKADAHEFGERKARTLGVELLILPSAE